MTRQRDTSPLVLSQIRGRDGSTTAVSMIPQGKCLEALNVDWFRASFARKRGGAAAFSLSGSGLNGVIAAAFRHVPSADDTAAEAWLIDAAGTVARYAGGSWTNPTLKDAISARPQDVIGVSFNGKLYFAYDSAVDRLHVWDPTTGSVRRTGLATPTGFTSADLSNTGAGTYAATPRWYRIRAIEVRSSLVYRRSEPTSAVTITPSGTGTAIRFTFSGITLPSEDETHWEIEGSEISADGPFYTLTTVAIATGTYDDTTAPSAYANGELAMSLGACTNWTSVKYVIADDNRLLGASAWESGQPVNTVYVSPVLGTTSAVFFDDEVVPTANANKYAFNEKDSGFITGLGGPVDNQILVLKNRQVWRLIPTGIATNPYRRKIISRDVGNLRQQAVLVAGDAAGIPSCYWLSQYGPYRWGPGGLCRMVWDVKDIWDTVNQAATTVVCHGLFHGDKYQIWWWVSVGAGNEPTQKLVYDTALGRVVDIGDIRDGWSVHDGNSAAARCSVMLSNTLAATMSRDLKPYIGQTGASNRLWKCDTSDMDDAGTAFQSYVDCPDRHMTGLLDRVRIHTPWVLGSVGSHTLRGTLRQDYGAFSRTGDVTMTATSDGGAETRILKEFENLETTDAMAVGVRVGDASAVAAAWTIDAVGVPYEGLALR